VPPDARAPQKTPPSLTAEPLIEKGLAPVLARNIAAQQARRAREEADASWQHKLADRITGFAGSLGFVWMHLLVVAFWVAANLGRLPGVPRYDPQFMILATAASVEAIFLSTFVLISQNRAAAAESRRAELDLHINLLAEHEVTRLIALTKAIAAKLGVEEAHDPDLEEISRDISPETVVEGLEDAERAASAGER
jgi:uncharacterized membrane protein